jgi:sugar phosphate isomerase/epimerase
MSTLSSFADEAGPSIDEQIAASKRAGLGFIDLRNVDGFNISVLPLHHAQTVAEKLRAAGIRVNMFGSPLGKIDIAEDFAIDIQKMEHLAKFGPIFDCPAIRIFSYYNAKAAPHADWQCESLRRLAELTRLAQSTGMILYHENESHIFGDKCADVLAIAQSLRGPNFKTIFDFGNYNAGQENAWENWLQLAPYTDAIHLKDNIWQDGALQHVPVGEGGGHVERILTDARSKNWQGPLVIEPHLAHSAAVAATGPSGIPNQSYTNMPTADSFHAAVMAAQKLLARTGPV